MTPLRRASALIAAGISLLAPVPASAATTRHAAPGGSVTNDCTATDAAHVCEIHHAIAVASSSDEVVLEPGVYDIASEVDVTVPLTLRGVVGQPRPRLVGQPGVATTLSVNPASSDILRHLAVESQSANGTAIRVQTGAGGTATVEDVIAGASGGSANAIYFVVLDRSNPFVLRDSVARTTGATSAAVRVDRASANQPLNSSLDIRNVTADARGPDSVGVSANARPQISGCANITLNVRNAIAMGTRADINAVGYGGACPATVDVYNSNWRTKQELTGGVVVNHEGNRTAVPAFVDAAAGDYHQLVASPTVDAGLPDPLLGATDIDGDPRWFGSQPDMGADEYVPPPPPQGGDGGGTPPGTPPGGGGAIPPDTTPPAFTAAKVTNTTFAVDPKGAAEAAVAARRAKKGTAFVYTVSEQARVVFTVEQKLPGRRVGTSCKKPSRANRRGKSCTRYKLVGRFAQDGVAGANTKKFSGKIGKKTMSPGAYRASLVATDPAGNHSQAKPLNLKVVRR